MRKNNMFFWAAAFFLLFAQPGGLFAQKAQKNKIVIKMATIVPEKTHWAQAFNKISAEWSKITGGEVELIIYHNNLGNEEDLLRKLKLNQIQIAVLGTPGLGKIDDKILTISAPLLIRNNGELTYVMENITPEIEQSLKLKGFFTLGWSKVGWVRFFSKTPVRVPSDLKKMRLATSEDEPELTEVFRTMGYRLSPMARNQTLQNLGVGTVDSVYQSPVYAASTQIFGVAKNMCPLLITPVLGGIIIKNSTWDSIPAKYKNDMLRAVKNMEKELDESIAKLEDEVIDLMKQYGLAVTPLTAEEEALWVRDVENAMPSLLGKTFNRETYERIRSLLSDYRKQRM
ncbi:MAG: TRAP transporter substrate-binding protein DctP [Spirochaetaceae bacterium]|jgi:TRAP-type C4-dicarboxylate transport system substrate-binding protein|nr:TRAP transporter substrate-binding protein DctP [Spirochaetaceae bacterium]